jgi:L-galactose dehydrogenase/L-glyceraldehyde 3-phosphate reductase
VEAPLGAVAALLPASSWPALSLLWTFSKRIPHATRKEKGMQKRRFGRTGLQVPLLTFGGGWVGGLLIRGSEAEREGVLNRALDAGIDWIDTAALYGNGVSETAIGQWLRAVPSGRRPRISTKFNIDTSTGDFAGQVERSVAASLQRLGLGKVPLLILHSRVVDAASATRDNRSLNPEEVLGAGGIADIMDKLRAQGLADWIGLTALGDPGSLHRVIDSGRFDVAQVYYNMLNPTAMAGAGPGWSSTDFDGLLHRCAAQDMGVMGIRIFSGGHLATSERHGREVAITANAENAAEEARAQAVWEVLGSGHGSGPDRAALRPRLPAALHHRCRHRREVAPRRGPGRHRDGPAAGCRHRRSGAAVAQPPRSARRVGAAARKTRPDPPFAQQPLLLVSGALTVASPARSIPRRRAASAGRWPEKFRRQGACRAAQWPQSARAIWVAAAQGTASGQICRACNRLANAGPSCAGTVSSRHLPAPA